MLATKNDAPGAPEAGAQLLALPLLAVWSGHQVSGALFRKEDGTKADLTKPPQLHCLE